MGRKHTGHQQTGSPTYGRRIKLSFGAPILVAAALTLGNGEWPAHQALAGDKLAQSAKAAAEERVYHGALPQSVVDMREQILAAVHAGSIDELKGAIEWNELKPDFGPAGNDDPIAYWKRVSGDGEGRQVLAVLANLLALAPARLAIGRDPENALVYVWPYLAELPLDSLTPAEEVDLYRLMPAAEAKAMRAAKAWTWWRVAIGADGTWHTFRKY
ncbi:MAG: hypothetical protein AB7S70_01645 [Hyphomicrobium sp.]|uniref:hypothetical protein n=1 Tax=Hyphomicrobium sp. TaxID=82 RepID=UPI003D1099CA